MTVPFLFLFLLFSSACSSATANDAKTKVSSAAGLQVRVPISFLSWIQGVLISVGDPDPHVYGPPGSGSWSISQDWR
jgi:hypothetical protein